MVRTGPRGLADERRFQPLSIEQARALYDALVDQGTPISQARGLVTWLIVLPDRRGDDPAANSTCRDYRRELARLGVPPWAEKSPGANEDTGAYRARSAQFPGRLQRFRHLGRIWPRVTSRAA